MSIDKKVDATLKNLEGKAQEMIGEVTGDPKQKAEGEAKQAEAAAQHTVENIKDAAKDVIDNQ
ncbi:MAG: CsbD family protein [Microcoleaceae cyanobacterium]